MNVKGLVNSRPITYSGNDDELVLTPAHFLNPIGNAVSPLPDIDGDHINTVTGKDLVASWDKGKKTY